MTVLLTATVVVLFFMMVSASCGEVSFVQGDNAIDVMINGRRVTSYVYKPELTKPVLFPVMTFAGTVVTRGYPFEDIAGESRDHPHHTGVFFTYDEVNDTRFWAATASPPKIRQVKITGMKGGSDKGTLSVILHWEDMNGKPLLEEKRIMVFRPGVNEYSIDFSMTLTALDTTVVFKDTKEGMFAIRVASWLQEKDGTGSYISSRGAETAQNIWGRRAEWVRLEGDHNGGKVGIAILNHPSSTNFPTFWHARDYGLFSANPLGQSVFEQGTGVENPKPFELTLKPGKSALFRFCMIICDGPRTKAEIDKRFEAYRK
ncbi:PmoA family protein [bacterium]|nr:PmoA family protein [bacterium]